MIGWGGATRESNPPFQYYPKGINGINGKSLTLFFHTEAVKGRLLTLRCTPTLKGSRSSLFMQHITLISETLLLAGFGLPSRGNGRR